MVGMSLGTDLCALQRKQVKSLKRPIPGQYSLVALRREGAEGWANWAPRNGRMQAVSPGGLGVAGAWGSIGSVA